MTDAPTDRTDPAEGPLEERIMVQDAGEHVIRVERTERRVRAVFNGVTVADSSQAWLAHETRRMPVYYFPAGDVRMDLLTPSGRTAHDEHKGLATYYSLAAGGKTAVSAAWRFESPAEAASGLTGLVAFYWHKLDHWYEEDDEVYVHPRDPYHRVDVLHSSRHVRVVMLGETVAETTRPRLLFETNLPTRYYIPPQDVRLDLLVTSETSTECPYKGVASYYGVRVGETIAKDVAWTYRFPIPECPKIEGLICFFNEKVDTIVVDGAELPRPQTPWSRPATLITVTS